MKNKSVLYYILSLLLLVGFSSCENSKPQNSETLIVKSFNQKIESFKASKRRDCLNGIMEDAEVLVDSIIAQQLNIDTIDFPRKPIKPNSPNLKEIPEEFELAPIK